MNRYLLGAILGGVAVLVLGGAVLVGMSLDGGSGSTPTASSEQDPSSSESESLYESEEDSAPLGPMIEDDLTCDYLLGSGTSDDDYRFVAGGTISNVGDVGVVVRVKSVWKRLGEQPITATRKVRIKSGGEKDVQIKLPATGDQIDAHQSADNECSVRAKIVE